MKKILYSYKLIQNSFYGQFLEYKNRVLMIKILNDFSVSGWVGGFVSWKRISRFHFYFSSLS